MSDIFEFNEKPYSLRINLQFRPDPNDKIWHESKKYGIEFFSELMLSCHLACTCSGKNKNLGSRKQSLRVMQSIQLPNKFYLTFSNVKTFDETLNLIKKLTVTFLHKYMFFPHFWLTLTQYSLFVYTP